MKYDLNEYIDHIREYHELVARKLSLSLRQLESASSIEEYQEVGILIRDSWIEFSRKLFSPSFVPQGTEQPGPSDAKSMLSFTFSQWPEVSDKLKKVCETIISLTNEIQHRRSIDVVTVEWCLSNTAMAMSFLLEIDNQHAARSKRRYYACPQCGSLNLTMTRDREVDYDGPGPEFEDWQCSDCDWSHYIYIG